MTCPKINNQADLDLGGHQPMFDSFFPYSQKTLGYKAHPAVNFISDKENAVNPLGKTGFYDPSSKEITIYTDGRHIKDVLRSIAHELVHHAQNERGEFDHELDTSPGYALEDGHLWNMEQEAYKDGNSCFRRWEDTYKQQLKESKKMRRSKLKSLVREELYRILNEEAAHIGSWDPVPSTAYSRHHARAAATKSAEQYANREKMNWQDASRIHFIADADADPRQPDSLSSRAVYYCANAGPVHTTGDHAGLPKYPDEWVGQPVLRRDGTMGYRCKKGLKSSSAGAAPAPPAAPPPPHKPIVEPLATTGTAAPTSPAPESFAAPGRKMLGRQLWGNRARCPKAIYRRLDAGGYTMTGCNGKGPEKRVTSPRKIKDLEKRFTADVRESRSMQENRLRAKRAHRVLNRLMGKIGKG